MKILHMATFLLVVVGALNWGLIGLFDFNLVTALVGSISGAEQIVYTLVGVSAVYELFTHPKSCMTCSTKK